MIRDQSTGEEIANSISHGIGFLGAVAVTPFLIHSALPDGASGITGVSIFSATMMLLYGVSCLYHAFPQKRVKRLFQIFDHGAIFLLIAGTYTPFTLVVLKGAWGWSLFGVVWALAFFGILIKTLGGPKSGALSTGLYLAMGWLAVVAARPLYANLSGEGLFWLLAGGLMYSGGVIFFVLDSRVKYSHFIWHLFVLAGTACHVVAIFKS
jgi:hemolysin III